MKARNFRKSFAGPERKSLPAADNTCDDKRLLHFLLEMCPGFRPFPLFNLPGKGGGRRHAGLSICHTSMGTGESDQTIECLLAYPLPPEPASTLQVFCPGRGIMISPPLPLTHGPANLLFIIPVDRRLVIHCLSSTSPLPRCSSTPWCHANSNAFSELDH